MATDAQKARRKRNRQNKAKSSNKASTSSGKTKKGLYGNQSAFNPLATAGVWFTRIESFAITHLSGTPRDKVWSVTLDSIPHLKTKLNTSGEYRLLSIRCTYNPITAVTNDRVGIAPYFDPINKLSHAADFLANGRPLRKGDSRFHETWNVRSEVTSISDVAHPLPIIGGVSIYFHKGGHPAALAQTDAFVITVDVAYQVRGKRAELTQYPAV